MPLDASNLSISDHLGVGSEDVMDMQTVHVVLLDILRIVVDLCETHSIDYFLIGGGCLGIARHDHQIIPWDDDLDVSIWANDMPRFIEAAKDLPPRYRITIKGQILNPTVTVSDTTTRIDFDEPSKRQSMCAEGVFIDIVPMMHWPSIGWKRIDDYYAIALSISLSTYSPTRWKEVLKKLLYCSGLPHLVVFLGRWFYLPLVQRMNDRCRAQNTGFISGAVGKKWKGRYPWNVIFPLKKRQLGSSGNMDKVILNTPNDLHEFLCLRYGNNYMQQPKAEVLWKHFDRAVRIKP